MVPIPGFAPAKTTVRDSIACSFDINSGVEQEYQPSMVSSIIDSSCLVQDFVKKKMSGIKNTEVVEKVKKM